MELTAEPNDVKLLLCGCNGWRNRVMDMVRVWLDILLHPKMINWQLAGICLQVQYTLDKKVF